MGFEYSQRTNELAARLTVFMLHIADGPDEVHRNQIGKLELSKYRVQRPAPERA